VPRAAVPGAALHGVRHCGGAGAAHARRALAPHASLRPPPSAPGQRPARQRRRRGRLRPGPPPAAQVASHLNPIPPRRTGELSGESSLGGSKRIDTCRARCSPNEMQPKCPCSDPPTELYLVTQGAWRRPCREHGRCNHHVDTRRPRRPRWSRGSQRRRQRHSRRRGRLAGELRPYTACEVILVAVLSEGSSLSPGKGKYHQRSSSQGSSKFGISFLTGKACAAPRPRHHLLRCESSTTHPELLRK
jgi:hypothetical protein